MVESDPAVRVLAEDLVLVDWGPMTLTVSAWLNGRGMPVIAAKAARTALFCLNALADFQGYLRRTGSPGLPPHRSLPGVVRRASAAAGAVSGDLTPLAAVAGAVADEVATRAAGMGADRVIVNNGGDIALRLRRGRQAVVGLKPPGSDDIMGRLLVKGSTGIGGVASSGWAGRSHSPGVADMVTVWSATAGLADAAATFIAGKTDVDGENIKKLPARELDPMSDLGDMPVTERVDDLSPGQRRRAVGRGAAAAESLYRKGLIRGCLIRVQTDSVLLDPEGFMENPA